MAFITTKNICSPATGRFFHPTSFTSELRTPNSHLFLFSPHLVFCASGTFSGNNQRKHDSFWSNAHKHAGSPRLFRFLKPGAEGSLIHPEPARSVLQRFPPIRRRELEPSDFRPRFKRCHRQKKTKKKLPLRQDSDSLRPFPGVACFICGTGDETIPPFTREKGNPRRKLIC